jgi:hypothetical protein
MYKFHKVVLGLAAVATVAVSTTGVTFAKGGSTGGSTAVPITTGVCSEVTATADNSFVYPLTNDNFPGSVAVTIGLDRSAPYAQSVCLENGWTVQTKSVTDGIQMQFNYNGDRAIDFKYVLGKTDIRNY